MAHAEKTVTERYRILVGETGAFAFTIEPYRNSYEVHYLGGVIGPLQRTIAGARNLIYETARLLLLDRATDAAVTASEHLKVLELLRSVHSLTRFRTSEQGRILPGEEEP